MGDSRDIKETERTERKGNLATRILRHAYRTLTMLLTLMAAGVFLLAAFSDHVSPLTWLHISYLGIAFPVLLALAAAWTVLLLLLRRWMPAAVMVVAFLVAHDAVTRTFPLHFGTSSSPDVTLPGQPVDKTLTILTYNTCRLGMVPLSDGKAKVPIMDVVRQSGADVVCMQEYSYSVHRDGHTEEQLRQSLADIYPYYHYFPYYGRQCVGLALFSRYPIKQVRRVDERKEYFASVCYVLDVNGRELAIVNNHLHTTGIRPDDRVFYDHMVKHFQSDSLGRVRQNLVHQLGSGYLARATQSEDVAAACRSLGDEMPLIVCGDMNDTPVSYCYHTIRGDLGDTWQDVGRGLGITYNQHKMWVRIDHLFHSRHLRPTAIRVLDEYRYSDHFPVLATYRWQNP